MQPQTQAAPLDRRHAQVSLPLQVVPCVGGFVGHAAAKSSPFAPKPPDDAVQIDPLVAPFARETQPSHSVAEGSGRVSRHAAASTVQTARDGADDVQR